MHTSGGAAQPCKQGCGAAFAARPVDVTPSARLLARAEDAGRSATKRPVFSLGASMLSAALALCTAATSLCTAAPARRTFPALLPDPLAAPWPSNVAQSAVGAAIMAYGFYKVGQSNRERRAIKAANYEARAALVPFLQARQGQGRAWARARALASLRIAGWDQAAFLPRRLPGMAPNSAAHWDARLARRSRRRPRRPVPRCAPPPLPLKFPPKPPHPQAEEDRRWVNANNTFRAKQAEVMKHVRDAGMTRPCCHACLSAGMHKQQHRWRSSRRPCPYRQACTHRVPAAHSPPARALLPFCAGAGLQGRRVGVQDTLDASRQACGHLRARIPASRQRRPQPCGCGTHPTAEMALTAALGSGPLMGRAACSRLLPHSPVPTSPSVPSPAAPLSLCSTLQHFGMS